MGAALAVALVPAASFGALALDIRFADGSNLKQLTPAAVGTSIPVEVWARVTGTDGTHVGDEMSAVYMSLVSSEVGGFAVQGSIAGSTYEPFNGTGSRIGEPSNISPDHLTDWGSTSTAFANNGYMMVRSTAATLAGGSVGIEVDANTWEFKVATFNVNVAALGTGSTKLTLQKPSYTATINAGASFAVYRQDGILRTARDLPTPTSATPSSAGIYGDFVTLTVPEPTSLALLGLGAVGMLARRRK